MKLIAALSLLLILVIGAYKVYARLSTYRKMLRFAIEYREKFITLTNAYWSTYDSFNRSGTVLQEVYIWLTKHVGQMQSDLGYHGTMTYVGPWQRFKVDNYQILINTLPKFRNNQLEQFDVHATDDALIRHMGVTEESIKSLHNSLRNPFIWFREGFKTLFGLPVYILNWFGILSDYTTRKVIKNSLFKLLAGIGALVTLVSGIVTIIQGKDQALSLYFAILKALHLR